MSGAIPFSFPAFFTAVHGHAPFAWQTRLSETVSRDGWPRVIAAPTGAGKTAAIDIALHHLACELATGARRRAPVRIVLAVDRRTIVDQAHRRSLALRDALENASDGILAEMAAVLVEHAGTPLHVASLRGGIPREHDWTRTPSQPTVLSTTVDQLGSRLLFRGYGVSDRMAPIHAGLLGNDCLILLDEAHLSVPFLQTLDRIATLRAGTVGESAPWAVSQLTATPQTEGARFELSDRERRETPISRRIGASKRAQLLLAKAEPGSGAHVRAFVDAADRIAAHARGDGQTIAVIVNRVRLARAIRDELACTAEAVLLTGRVRPLGRDVLVERIAHRLDPGRTGEYPAPLFVVATQCIEAGVDFDFDAMVTQIAPLDALRQRFGRLNRLGERDDAPATIVATSEETRARHSDVLYLDRPARTWTFLESHSAKQDGSRVVDMGVAALEALERADPEAAAGCVTVAPEAPLLRRADLDFLSMTAPRPSPDPYIPLFLHGRVESESDVSIVWRADLSPAAPDFWRRVVACLPPRAAEALSVPISAARRWLRGQAHADDVGDVDGQSALHESRRPPGAGRQALLWRGANDERTAVVEPAQIRPGDVLVVPSEYGGCDEFGWAPAARAAVTDLAEAAALPFAARTFALRVHAACAAEDGGDSSRAALLRLLEEDAEPAVAAVRAVLAEHEGDPTTSRLLALPARALTLEFPYPSSPSGAVGFVLTAPCGLRASGEPQPPEATTDLDDAGSFSVALTTLEDHARTTESTARRFAESLGLSPRLVKSAALAARLHDDGKANPRFQFYLAGGWDEAAPALAKGFRRSASGDRAARLQSGLPERWRHEVLSVRIAQEKLRREEADIDPGLVLYLVGVHHGHGRPFFAHDDPWDQYDRSLLGHELAAGPSAAATDFEWDGRDWPGLFLDLRRRYGDWGLALLETIVRLADHRASEVAAAGVDGG